MILVEPLNILGLCDEEELKKFKFNLSDFKDVDGWTKYEPGLFDSESELYPIVEGKILEWAYSSTKIKQAIEIINILNRDYTFKVNPVLDAPLLVEIEKFSVDKTQMYILVAQRVSQ